MGPFLPDGTLQTEINGSLPDRPVHISWLHSSFDGPNGNIYGGGRGVTFTQVSDGVWLYLLTQHISPWSPSGEYRFSEISVGNEGQLGSADYSNPPTIYVTNAKAATKPVITSVTTSVSSLPSQGGSFD